MPVLDSVAVSALTRCSSGRQRQCMFVLRLSSWARSWNSDVCAVSSTVTWNWLLLPRIYRSHVVSQLLELLYVAYCTVPKRAVSCSVQHVRKKGMTTRHKKSILYYSSFGTTTKTDDLISAVEFSLLSLY